MPNVPKPPLIKNLRLDILFSFTAFFPIALPVFGFLGLIRGIQLGCTMDRFPHAVVGTTSADIDDVLIDIGIGGIRIFLQ